MVLSCTSKEANCTQLQLLANKNISILITDHNAREIFSVVHRSYIVSEGKVTYSGNVDELVNNEAVRRSYLGMEFKMSCGGSQSSCLCELY